MNLLGQRVRDSVTGITGTVIALAQYLHDSEGALVAHGPAFEQSWLAVGRLTVVAAPRDAVPNANATPAAEKPAAAKPAQTNGAATNGATPPAAPATPQSNPVTVAVETYAKVAAAFIVLGKAGQGATIQAILKSHNVAHAKQISDNAAALADVLKQATAAIAALAPTV